jgi:hypothetical protein
MQCSQDIQLLHLFTFPFWDCLSIRFGNVPLTTLLTGVRVPSHGQLCLMGFECGFTHYHRLTPLYGLMTSRYRGGYAFTCTLQGWEFNPQDFQVVKV